MTVENLHVLKKFKHKPTVIEAIQWKPELEKSFGTFKKLFGPPGEHLFLEATKHGKVLMFQGKAIPHGAYVVKGIDESVYWVNEHTFRQLYNPSSDAST